MQKKTFKHLTLEDRVRIETLIKEGFSLRYIADRLDKSPSSISREIKNYSVTVSPKCCDCVFQNDCSNTHICGSSGCYKKCKFCSKAKKYCSDYVQAFCETRLAHPLKLCNTCCKKAYCHFERAYYYGDKAHQQSRDNLINPRSGFNLTLEELIQINDVVSPLVQRGQSVYHIHQTHKEILPVSESSLRRLIGDSELDARPIDLPEAVKRKERQKPRSSSNPPVSKAGHLYQDYLAFINLHDTLVVQMDCIEGCKSDSGAVLSLHFSAFHMQLYFMLERHDSASVTAMLDRIETSLGKDLFASAFPLILTDNGTEFSDISGMERSVFGGKRTTIYFCEPNRSDQKGQCENNHKLFRRIIPKGTSIERLMQTDMTLITNHINSYVRKSLFGKSPYSLAMAMLPEDFFFLLGLDQLPATEVMLTPELLN